MGKKVLRLFLETMLRALVIILAIGIVIMGALLIKTLVKNNSLKDSKKTTNGKEIVTEAGDENDPTFKNGVEKTVDQMTQTNRFCCFHRCEDPCYQCDRNKWRCRCMEDSIRRQGLYFCRSWYVYTVCNCNLKGMCIRFI